MNILPYLGVGFSVIVAIANILILVAVKFNDLKHLQADLDEMKKDLKCVKDNFMKLDERVSNIEGKIS
jgi:uncharacterized protein YoxC